MPITESIIRVEEEPDRVVDITPALPTGSSLGIRHFHATDAMREDVSTGERQFMITAFYPGRPDPEARRGRLADLLHPRIDDALELLARESGLGEDEKASVFRHLKAMALRARRGIAIEGSEARPVLIYYPGGQGHRLSNAALCEALASRGFVVFALDAPRDAPVVVFPDGSMVTPPAPDDESYIWPRVADVRFLLDGLEEMNSAFFGGCLDLGRIGMFGHSRGGYLSNICAVEDGRVRAAVNMDGFLWGIWAKEGTGLNEYPPEFAERARGLKTPILRIRSDRGDEEKARREFEEESRDFGGVFIYAALNGYKHADFSTTPWHCGAPQDFAANAGGPNFPVERVELLTELLSDFFETYLNGQPSRMALLARKSVKIHVRLED